MIWLETLPGTTPFRLYGALFVFEDRDWWFLVGCMFSDVDGEALVEGWI